MKRWKGGGIEETERNWESGCRQQARQHRAEGAEPLLSSWHIHMAQSLSVILDQVQKYSSAALPLLLVPWRRENKPIVPLRLKC